MNVKKISFLGLIIMALIGCTSRNPFADREGIPWTECKPQGPGEPANYGGFYTKADIREIVDYARQRFVTIIPEIEMPGHTSDNIENHKIIGMKLIYREPLSERYPGTGPQPLNDGIRGSLNFNDGYWQGFNGNNMDVVVEFDQDLSVKSISTTFLLDQKKWIFVPEKVNYYGSNDGKKPESLDIC